MSDTYQAIYDAVRSRISGGDIGEVVREVAFRAFDISHLTAAVAQDFSISALEMQRPSVLFRPTVKKDGNTWCALYGPNLQEGVCGFGDTPDKAMRAFDAVWSLP